MEFQPASPLTWASKEIKLQIRGAQVPLEPQNRLCHFKSYISLALGYIDISNMASRADNLSEGLCFGLALATRTEQ